MYIIIDHELSNVAHYKNNEEEIMDWINENVLDDNLDSISVYKIGSKLDVYELMK